MRRERIDVRLVPIRTPEMLVKDVAGDSVKVRRQALVADLGILCKLTRYTVDRIVSKLKRRNTASTFKVLHETASNMLVLLARAVRVRTQPREKLIKGLLIKIPLTDLNIPPIGQRTD